MGSGHTCRPLPRLVSVRAGGELGPPFAVAEAAAAPGAAEELAAPPPFVVPAAAEAGKGEAEGGREARRRIAGRIIIIRTIHLKGFGRTSIWLRSYPYLDTLSP